MNVNPVSICIWRLLMLCGISLLPPLSIVLSHLVAAGAAASNSSLPGPDCPWMCGNVEIHYPFGIGEGCRRPGFSPDNLTCNHSFSPPRLYLNNILQVISISPQAGELRILTDPSYICYLSSTNYNSSSQGLELANPFLTSATSNEFTAIGCNTIALLKGMNYYTGCVTYCESIQDTAADGDNCTGLGCCQIPIAGNLSTMEVDWNRDPKSNVSNPAWEYSPCSYAFVAEKGWYQFRRQDLVGYLNTTFFSGSGGSTIPLVLDWAIRDDGSCRPPPKQDTWEPAKPTAPACVSANSFCEDAKQGRGYICNCTEGYSGNPYVTGERGCIDINECDLRISNPEKYEGLYPCYSGSTCHDTEGGYKCKCKFGQHGDGKFENGCQSIFTAWVISILVVGVIFIVAAIAIFSILEVKRRKQRRFFNKNGGDILKNMGIGIFTEDQLKKITNGYKKSIGEGVFGKVYIGITDNAEQVAVKCSSKKGDVVPQVEFVNEITFQFHIRHGNLVRLVGCCLETDVPMLVYEFVPRGSLHNMLHGTGKRLPLSLPARLNIAVGSAEALAFMHSHSGHNHVHGDVKSSNILLDENLTPKVSDFGSAKLLSDASRYSKWCVSGDMSYIDPIYIKSGRFTEKSDVYSFGVVLLELVTRKPAKYGDNSLCIEFIKSYKEEGNGRKLYDKEILSGDNAQSHHLECVDRISKLAVQSLKEDVDERPTMAEVVDELKQVKSMASGSSSSVAS